MVSILLTLNLCKFSFLNRISPVYSLIYQAQFPICLDVLWRAVILMNALVSLCGPGLFTIYFVYVNKAVKLGIFKDTVKG